MKKLELKSERTCGSCTKCCEGWLTGQVDDVPFYKGIPCKNCVSGHGCSSYETRPEEPCKTFKCSWISDYSTPEFAKPSTADAIVYIKKVDNVDIPCLVPAGKEVEISFLSWFIIWALSKYGCAVWFNQFGSRFYLGSDDVVNKVDLNSL